jgi:hypothetical protein
MAIETPDFPSAIWDGLSDNANRVTRNYNVSPDWRDWDQISAEVISMQRTAGGASPHEDITGDTTLVPASAPVQLVDATTAPVTVSLRPASELAFRRFEIKKVDASANAVTIDADGSDLIDGLGSRQLVIEYASITIYSDGITWHIL